MISDPSLLWLVIVSGIACFFMAFVTGANDIANTFSTSIGSKAITLGKAIIIAFVFETLGACLLGGTVTDSIRTKIINFDSFEDAPEFLMLGMCCALIGAGLWLAIATFAGIPVSTTHSIVGALTGFGLATGKIDSIRWNKIYSIVIAWVMAPVLAGSCSAVAFIILRKFILRNKNSLEIIKRMYWVLIFMITLPFTVFLVYHNPITLNTTCLMWRDAMYVTASPCYLQEWSSANLLYSILACLILSSLLTLLTSCVVYRIYTLRIQNYRLKKSLFEQDQLDIEKNGMREEGYNLKNSSLRSDTSNETQNTQIDEPIGMKKKLGVGGKENKTKKGYKDYFTMKRMQYEAHMMNDDSEDKGPITTTDINIEQFDIETEIVFSALQIISAILGVIAQSANDTANAIGPFAAVFNTYENGLKGKLKVQWYILLFGGLSMSMGLAILGYKVIKTVGMKLIKMTPSRGFTVELVAGLVVLFFSIAGMPLSSTHCAVSSVVGVGLVESRMGGPKKKVADSSNEIIVDAGKSNKLEDELEKKNCFSCLNASCVNLKLFRTVFLSWIVTVLFSASVTAAIFAFAAYSPGYRA